MNQPSPHVVEQTLRIGARPETVWRYWTDPERLCAWWGAVAELDARPGGTCRVEMTNGLVMVGAYVELEPFDRLVFSFGWEPTPDAPEIPPGSTRVEVTLVPDAGDTILTVRHSGIPTRHAGDHSDGWTYHLGLLVAAVDAASVAVSHVPGPTGNAPPT